MQPTTTWICDTCGELIETVEAGWVEWLVIVNRYDTADKRQGRGLRLVHHQPASPRRMARYGSCQYDAHAEFQRDGASLYDLPLSSFLGPDGLNLLLSMIAEDELPTEDVLEMTKRLHIPGYEHARRHFARAIAEGVFEPNMLKGYYWQHDIEAVLKAIEREK